MDADALASLQQWLREVFGAAGARPRSFEVNEFTLRRLSEVARTVRGCKRATADAHPRRWCLQREPRACAPRVLSLCTCSHLPEQRRRCSASTLRTS
jgi:hypothetical protein